MAGSRYHIFVHTVNVSNMVSAQKPTILIPYFMVKGYNLTIYIYTYEYDMSLSALGQITVV